MIIMLLVISGYLFHINSEYKEVNRKLILENDSLLSVNHQLINTAAPAKSSQEVFIDGKKSGGESDGNAGSISNIVTTEK